MLFDMPKKESHIIKVIGVGGGGGNAVGHMYEEGIIGVDFAICNTDNQALDHHKIPNKIQLGPALTVGRGAGSNPDVGKQACIESIDEVRKFLETETKMLFVTAGMGGGTGTGAAPIIAQAAREMEILTVGIVTLPFRFEGNRRKRQAMEGLENLKKAVDAILVISNDRLKEIYGDLGLGEAFAKADNILTTAAKGIAEIITVPGQVNVDFEDVNTVMRNSGVAIMGSAVKSGEGRAREAINAALNSPLLEDNDIRGAQHILLNITSGKKEVTMAEIGEITEYVQEEAGYGTDLIWGHCHDESLDDELSVTLIATGFEEGRKLLEDMVKATPIKVAIDDEVKRHDEREVMDITETSQRPAERVYEFSDNEIRQTKEDISRHTIDDGPMIKQSADINVHSEEEDLLARKRREMEDARREYLRNANAKSLDDPKAISNMESEPAYLRRNVELEDLKGSGQAENRTNLSIGADADKPIIESRNSFLHDNVD